MEFSIFTSPLFKPDMNRLSINLARTPIRADVPKLTSRWVLYLGLGLKDKGLETKVIKYLWILEESFTAKIQNENEINFLHCKCFLDYDEVATISSLLSILSLQWLIQLIKF